MTDNTGGIYPLYIFGGIQYSSNPPLYYGYNTINFMLTVTNSSTPSQNTFGNTNVLFNLYSQSSRNKTISLIKNRLGKLFR